MLVLIGLMWIIKELSEHKCIASNLPINIQTVKSCRYNAIVIRIIFAIAKVAVQMK